MSTLDRLSHYLCYKLSSCFGIPPGLYRHYKGGIYDVLGVALHSEEDTAMVVYISDKGFLWVRPASMFTEMVTDVNGASVPRFNLLRRNDETSQEQEKQEAPGSQEASDALRSGKAFKRRE